MWTYTTNSDELKHHGVKGMKWGIRRYQRKDGSLTNLGKKRVQERLKQRSHDYYSLYVKKKSDYEVSEYAKYRETNPKFNKKYDSNTWKTYIMDRDAYYTKLRSLGNEYVSERSAQTLNDLGLELTDKAKSYTENLVNSEWDTKYIKNDVNREKREQSEAIEKAASSPYQREVYRKDPEGYVESYKNKLLKNVEDYDEVAEYQEFLYDATGEWYDKSDAERIMKKNKK